MIKLSDIPKHTENFQKLLGAKLVNFIRKRVQKMHFNVDLKTFSAYSVDYGEAKRRGKAAPKGIPQASKSIMPDMTLTGKTMADLKVINVTKKSFVFGWIGLHGGIVRDLHGHKNYQIVNLKAGEPLSRLEDGLIHQAYDKDYNGKIDKWMKESLTFKLKF